MTQRQLVDEVNKLQLHEVYLLPKVLARWLNKEKAPDKIRNFNVILAITKALKLTKPQADEVLSSVKIPNIDSLWAQHKTEATEILLRYWIERPIFEFPYPRKFVGRANELEIIDAFIRGELDSSHEIFVISGMSGIGKTWLTREFANLYGKDFPGGVFFINFSEPQTIPLEIARCGTLPPLRLGEKYEKLSLENQVTRVKQEWEKPIKRLLIFDNCEYPDLVSQWRPRQSNVKILATSRKSNWPSIYQAYVLHLKQLARSESIELMTEYDKTLSPNVADEIAAELGDLPLALHGAGSYISTYQHAVKPEAYLKELKSIAFEHSSLRDSVTQVYNINFGELNSLNQRDKDAEKLLAWITKLSPGEPVARKILIKILKDEDKVEIRIHDAISRLSELGFLNGATGEQIQVHTLIHSFLYSKLNDKYPLIQDLLEELTIQEVEESLEMSDLKLLQIWHKHLLHITKQALSRKDNIAARLSRNSGEMLSLIGVYDEAEGFFKSAHNIHLLSNNVPSLEDSLNDTRWGWTYFEIGKIKQAKEKIQTALIFQQNLAESAHGENEKDRLMFEISENQMNLATLLSETGESETARTLFEKALAFREKYYGLNNYKTSIVYSELGFYYKDMDNLERSLKYFTKAFEIQEEIDHPDKGISLMNLGGVRERAGASASTLVHIYKQALQQILESFGETHRQTALIRFHLGQAYHKAKRLGEAKTQLELSIQIMRKLDLESGANFGILIGRYGQVLKELKEYREAKNNLYKAKSIIDSCLNEDNFLKRLLSIWCELTIDLGIVFEKLGSRSKACNHLQEVTDKCKLYPELNNEQKQAQNMLRKLKCL